MATVPTAAAFKVEFPEFASADDTLVDAKLADAAARTGADVWGSKWEMGVKYKAARLLALSPFGRKMRLVNNDGSTVYDADIKAMVRSVTSGHRVVGT